MDVDMVDGGDDALQRLLAIWTDREAVEARKFHSETMNIVRNVT